MYQWFFMEVLRLDYKFLGKRIREERLKLHLTQEKLAEEINISTAYLGQIERGERSITLDKLVPLANKLGVTIDFLLEDYLSSNDDTSINTLRQLFQNKTTREKEMAINILKLIFSYTDNKI